MPKYQVEIDAKNFLVEMDGELAKYGFISFQFVEADDSGAAERAAVQMLRDDEELRGIVLNEETDPPVMDVTKIVELAPTVDLPSQPGRVWYEMNPKRWWQIWRRR